MYKLIDDTFIGVWNHVRSSVNPPWIARLQAQLAEVAPAYLECSEEQAVEIRVTHHWLKAKVWQLSFCQGIIGNVPNEPCLTVMYLINISRDLLSMTHQFSQEAMEAHGAGLVSFVLHPRFLCRSRGSATCIPYSTRTKVCIQSRDFLFVPVRSSSTQGTMSYSDNDRAVHLRVRDKGLYTARAWYHVQFRVVNLDCTQTGVLVL
jgi:hypothetical protein